jgi:hypothetical protein
MVKTKVRAIDKLIAISSLESHTNYHFPLKVLEICGNWQDRVVMISLREKAKRAFRLEIAPPNLATLRPRLCIGDPS